MAAPIATPDPAKLYYPQPNGPVRDLPETDHLLGELFSTTSRGIFYTDTGLGKTMFAVALAFALGLGRKFLHWHQGRPARVLFIDGEMPAT